jgi:transketolase
VRGWFRDDTPKRFESYGWRVIRDVDGHDPAAVRAAIEAARADGDRPTLIDCRTIIGKGSPATAGKETCHGAALGEKEVAATRSALGWPHAAFEIPKDVYAAWDARPRGAALEREWQERFDAYAKAHPELAREFRRRIAGELPANWQERVDALVARALEKGETVASRKASQQAIEALAPRFPSFSAAPRTSPAPTSRPGRARRRWTDAAPGTTSITACASSRWPRSATGSRCTAASFRTPGPSSRSRTIRATPCAWPH